MTTTITYPGGITIRPDILVVGSGDAEVDGRSITHDILDGAPVHTLRTARPQTGRLTCTFSSSALAHEAKDALTAAEVYTVTSDDEEAVNGLRMLVRSVRVTQDTETGVVWFVRIDYGAVV